MKPTSNLGAYLNLSKDVKLDQRDLTSKLKIVNVINPQPHREDVSYDDWFGSSCPFCFCWCWLLSLLSVSEHTPPLW